MTLEAFPSALQGLLALWSLLSASFSHPARPAACGAAWGCHGDHASMKKEGDVDAKWSRETWLLNSCPWGSGDRQGRCGWMVARKNWRRISLKTTKYSCLWPITSTKFRQKCQIYWGWKMAQQLTFGSQHPRGSLQRLITQGLGMSVPKDLRHSPSLLWLLNSCDTHKTHSEIYTCISK